MSLFSWIPPVTKPVSTPSNEEMTEVIRQHVTMKQRCCLRHGSWWYRLSDLMRGVAKCTICGEELVEPPEGTVFVWDERAAT